MLRKRGGVRGENGERDEEKRSEVGVGLCWGKGGGGNTITQSRRAQKIQIQARVCKDRPHTHSHI